MSAAIRFRSQLLACGAFETDAARAAHAYERALDSAEADDWRSFYRAVYESLEAIRSKGAGLTVFAGIELAEMFLLLQDDLGSELFEASSIADLKRDLLPSILDGFGTLGPYSRDNAELYRRINPDAPWALPPRP
jgi:hypothetical protein